MKTSELKGAALDWAVAQCEGVSFVWLETDYSTDGRTFQRGTAQAAGPHYSTNWSQGGPIIERERVQLRIDEVGRNFAVVWVEGIGYGPRIDGPTPLIAAMRCYVASKLGGTVNVPEELK